jgi:probable F420-dependent oxidoreductase
MNYPGRVVKVDFYYPPGPPEGAAEAARTAVELGYEGFFSAETQYDPFLPLAFASTREPGLEVGTAIAVAFPRSPMVVATTAWDLARMSGGKFMLGLGTQVRAHIVRRFSTTWDRPVPRLREYIQSLRAIWDAWQNSVPLDFKGDFYRFSLMTPFFNPGPIASPDVPVYIAGVGPRLSRLAGELCQGFHVHPFHTVRYLDDVVLPAMRAGAEGAGRAVEDVERATTVFIMTGETDAEIEQSMAPVRQQISFYASTPSYQPVLEANDWDFGAELTAMSKRGQWAEMADLVPEEAVLEVGVAAPIHRLAETIKQRYGDRVQRVGFYTIGSSLNTDPDALSEVILQLKTG